jgi:DNA-binding response OmpR family regulator
MNSKKTILVVDDDDLSRQAMCFILEGLGFESINFGSAQEVLKSITGKKIDLALLDIMMPNMNGYELLKQMKESDEFKTVPVIMVTAKDADSEVLEGYKYGADYYITKPFTSKQLEYGVRLYIPEDDVSLKSPTLKPTDPKS